MLTRKGITLVFIGILALGACTPPTAPAAEDTAIPNATSQPQASAAPEAASSTLTAALTELEGRVDLKNPGQDSFVAASADAVVEVNGQIQTGDDGRVRLDLSSGTIIRVAPSSLFTLTSNEEMDGGLATKIKLELGKIFIILSGGSAEVESPSGVAFVHGSYMMVTGDRVTCLEGECSFTNSAGTVHFTQGQRVTFTDCESDCTLPEVEDMSEDDYQEWLDANPEYEDFINGIAGGSPDACSSFAITEPLASSQNFQGKIKLGWGALPGATKYILTFTDANGNVVAFDMQAATSFEKYVEGFIPQGGQYSYAVTALGEDGSVLCRTEPATFSKPDSKYVPPPKPAGEEPACTDDPCDYFGSCYDPQACG